MPHSLKIATCCYCGSRAALTLKGRDRHELACANCGAPLHELKMLRTDARGDRELVPPSRVRGAPVAKGHRAPRARTRRSLSQRVAAKLWDAAEDALDEVFDIFD